MQSPYQLEAVLLSLCLHVAINPLHRGTVSQCVLDFGRYDASWPCNSYVAGEWCWIHESSKGPALLLFFSCQFSRDSEVIVAGLGLQPIPLLKLSTHEDLPCPMIGKHFFQSLI